MNVQEPFPHASTAPNAAEATLAQTFALFARQLEEKVASIEANVLALKQQIDGPDTLQSAFRDVINAFPQARSLGPAAMGPTSYGASGRPLLQSQTSPVPAKKKLHYAVEGLERRWFVKKVMPQFQVRLMDVEDQFRGSSGQPRELTVQLVDARGNYINNLLELQSGADASNKVSKQAAPFSFPIVDGVAVISGLRFLAVSSKHGKAFRLELSCPEHSLLKFKTDEIAVLSERLKSEKKALSIDELSPDDAIQRVPGIGKSYLHRWNQLGFKTVRDLASISVAPRDRPTRLELLGKLRKARGALTESRLMQLLRDAHGIVGREKQQRDQAQQQEKQQPPQQHTVRVTEPDTPSFGATPHSFMPPFFATQVPESEAQASQRKLGFDPAWSSVGMGMGTATIQPVGIQEIPITPGADVRAAPMIELPTTPTVEAVDAMINFDME